MTYRKLLSHLGNEPFNEKDQPHYDSSETWAVEVAKELNIAVAHAKRIKNRKAARAILSLCLRVVEFEEIE